MACDYCNPKVTFTKPIADCYLERFENEIRLMEEAGLPAQLVNLASCDGLESNTRGVGSLPTLSGQEPAKPDVSFVMDAVGMRCLAQQLQSETWAPEGSLTFEVRRDCQTQ